jgi:uncharacterized protein (TIGR02147 family)
MSKRWNLPTIYAFSDYRSYLAACLAALKDGHGMSVRSISKECGITSPNYIQQVVQAKRNLTPVIADRISAAFDHTETAHKYLLAMIKLERARTGLAKEAALKKMRQLVQASERITIEDHTFHSQWSNALVWELLKTKYRSQNPQQIRHLLRNSTTVDEIDSALRYLQQKQFFREDEAGLLPGPLDIKPSNDVRRIDLQRSHLRFLQLAEHRVNDPLDQREFQGLTVAVKKESFEPIRNLCRALIHAINEEFSVDEDGDEVLRVQLCVFKVSKVGQD